METNDTSSLLAHLETRRSARPRDIVAPGPDAAQLGEILQLAARTPDHGALVPYRFLLIEDREALADLFETACSAEDPDCTPLKRQKFRDKAQWAPTLVALIAAPIERHKIPVWEQELTVGAVGMNLLHAVHAHGFVGGWITGAQSYAPAVVDALCRGGERIAGFFYIGSPGEPLTERDRPAMDAIVSRWPS
ncbi:nitroreductase [Sphingomicrobium sp. XHP0239]|uniref:nitroreductase family protein n=1 Tax=Sphingomicrobium maritimum TaxID=3133972 RepID=UPI0031CC6F63